MKTIEYRTIDKASWSLRGEWDSEPDKMQWQDEATGLPCLIVRHPTSGHLCGYVGVPEGHPYYGNGYDDVDADVHGGLTFADKCQPSETESRGVCHLPEPGEPGHVWWFGFDCAHAWDLSPGRYDPKWICGDESYKNISFVRSHIASLARQLKEAS